MSEKIRLKNGYCGHGRLVQPDIDGRCGNCGASGFAYSNGHEWSACGIRGFRCNSCGDVKAERVRFAEGVSEPA